MKSGDIVLDIGRNDGTTLKFYQNLSLNLIGVDPSAEKFRKFYPSNIKLITEFFNYENLKPFLNVNKAKVITSFSMFYDLEDPVQFCRDIKKCLHKDGIWVLEQSYLGIMLEQIHSTLYAMNI